MKNDIITLAHGGGGIRTRNLIKELVLAHLGNPILNQLDDSAVVSFESPDLAFTTDSYVVNPLFFPGGDIGKLCMCGTINDLVMQGAIPKYIGLGLIIEEGFAIADLDKIFGSIAAVSRETGVLVVTGDTKVVEKGRGNGLYINTSGIGVRRPGVSAGISNAKPGNVVIVTGTIGDHGIAVIGKRQGLSFESDLESDVASLDSLISLLFNELVASINVLHDPTRGGVAAGVCDIAESSNVGIELVESHLPIKKAVKGACGLLGFDPLNVANEGKAIVVCSADAAERAISILRTHTLGKNARIIGSVVPDHPGMVLLKTAMGGERIVEVPAGEELPRIC
ncbi:MAG: hydrogenase expression/formation protein HypE [Candidatus Raymondbacteria bacterium RifOxyA12_full_50_37]|uniref:Hydrogenase expression/formation protein HypE n=1 Tax=Candidatus Raymondbacteria bacterium RIFOXYD12_FULL_49_13 TaxID=1817890 RepID=A0A1F7FCN7_UNCRA|nr:MAG: hydrogenase expression/formation protein HypE [Candidatus Raymondbacteria bacterium RifOxyA12_full_50_37]OGJ86426.1 MAG: hydrogenase expression/formation protein HypE [Candidatus Raymondbacteria bacterium RIFOXYA2_FULL_49_16]OGJ87916.1 MAG: hydrogenase expression/formation protein HypE [Candidatus Raymondbacteria bacterium RifOxyB12_full_50_8]OGJ95596.1 MAG: hydrogenase expression/formation protein HypE [Candidatus Raymondbacteria bacterium RIFOXYC2_FULL_50_21]OGK04450.1 MAG: hydrogenas